MDFKFNTLYKLYLHSFWRHILGHQPESMKLIQPTSTRKTGIKKSIIVQLHKEGDKKKTFLTWEIAQISLFVWIHVITNLPVDGATCPSTYTVVDYKYPSIRLPIEMLIAIWRPLHRDHFHSCRNKTCSRAQIVCCTFFRWWVISDIFS